MLVESLISPTVWNARFEYSHWGYHFVNILLQTNLFDTKVVDSSLLHDIHILWKWHSFRPYVMSWTSCILSSLKLKLLMYWMLLVSLFETLNSNFCPHFFIGVVCLLNVNWVGNSMIYYKSTTWFCIFFLLGDSFHGRVNSLMVLVYFCCYHCLFSWPTPMYRDNTSVIQITCNSVFFLKLIPPDQFKWIATQFSKSAHSFS